MAGGTHERFWENLAGHMVSGHYRFSVGSWQKTGFEGGVRLFLTKNPHVFNDVERFAFGLMGAITIGWGLTVLFLPQAIWAIVVSPLLC